MIPVNVAIAVLAIGALAGLVMGLRSGRRLLVVLAAVVAGAAAAMQYSGPSSTPVIAAVEIPAGDEVHNYGGGANFKDRYDENRAFFGNHIGKTESREAVLVSWYMYGRDEWHPEIADPLWKVQLGNVSQELMIHLNIPVEDKPETPPIVASFMAAETRSIWYWYGKQLTSPRKEGDQWVVYFQKQALCWPASKLDRPDDPASVRRLPVGYMLYVIEHPVGQGTTSDPWTPIRTMLGAGGLMGLLAIGGLVLLGVRRDGIDQ